MLTTFPGRCPVHSVDGGCRRQRARATRARTRGSYGSYPALIALISLGIGAIIRHTAGAICALVGVLFVLPLLFAPLSPRSRTWRRTSCPT